MPLSVPTIRERPVQGGDFPRHELESWSTGHGIVAGVTTRGSGGGLGLWCPERADSVLDRWLQFRESLGRSFDGVVVGRQVHGREIGRQDAGFRGILLKGGLDGHVTGQTGVLLTVTVADCVPVYLADPRSRVVAILHAGWRGVASGIVEAGIDWLWEITGSPADALIMHCGVSICGTCYQVGPDVFEAVTGEEARGPSLLDLRRNLVRRAADRGLSDITVSGFCTAHDRELFYSHRASGGGPGRMVAYVGYPNT